MPSKIKTEKIEKDGTTIWRRTIKDPIFGKIGQELIIAPDKVTLKTWSDESHSETTLERVQLPRPETANGKEINVALYYTICPGGYANDSCRTVKIVPYDSSHVDMLLQSIKDFDTFEKIIKCLHKNCKWISYLYVTECDISVCL